MKFLTPAVNLVKLSSAISSLYVLVSKSLPESKLTKSPNLPLPNLCIKQTLNISLYSGS